MITEQQRKQYLRTQIQTASQEQLVLMLFDGVIRFAEQARIEFEKDRPDFEQSHNSLLRAQAIITELLCSLDTEAAPDGQEIAENLGRLYAYSFQKLIEANMTHTTAPIVEVQGIIRELRDGWHQAMGIAGETAQRPAATTGAEYTQTQSAPTPAPEAKAPAETVETATTSATKPMPATMKAYHSGISAPAAKTIPFPQKSETATPPAEGEDRPRLSLMG